MVQAQASQFERLLVIGVLGEGKSTLMNHILTAHGLGSQFVAKKSVKSVTHAFQESSPFSNGRASQVQVVDSPGLFDPRLPWPQWIADWNMWLKTGGKGYNRLIWVIRATERVNENMAQEKQLIMKMLGDDEVQFQTRVIVIFTFCDKVAINSNLAISMVREVCGFQVNNVLLSTNQPLTLGAIGLPHQLDAPVELSPVNAREFCAANNINVAEETHVAAEELAQTKALAAQLQQMPTALEGGGTIGDLASKLTLLAKADPAKQVSYKIVFP